MNSTAAPVDENDTATDVVPVGWSVDRLAVLSAAVDEVVAVGVDRLDEPGLEAELKSLETLRCRRHHRDYDHGRLHLHHHPDGRPVLRPEPPDQGGPAP